MSHTPPHQIEYVTERYAEKLERFAESHQISRDVVKQTFREYCEELQGSFKDNTPADVVRRIAYQRLDREPPGEAVSATPEYRIEVDAESNSPRTAHE